MRIFNSTWNNSIPSHKAHAGTGEISVAANFKRGHGWNEWNGTPVQVIDDNDETNTTAKRALVGLHRHEANQEAWKIERGRYLLANGVAKVVPGLYDSLRPLEDLKDIHTTPQFDAKGGWMEFREVIPGDKVTIVPNGDLGTVFFHGLAGLTGRGIFETIGRQN